MRHQLQRIAGLFLLAVATLCAGDRRINLGRRLMRLAPAQRVATARRNNPAIRCSWCLMISATAPRVFGDLSARDHWEQMGFQFPGVLKCRSKKSLAA